MLRTPVKRLYVLVNTFRKEAADVNREFLDWLTRRRQPERPFFAFLNYYDAHAPYDLPSGRLHRFGTPPSDPRESDMIQSMVADGQDGDLPAGCRVCSRCL